MELSGRFDDPEEIARRFAREQRGVLRKREDELSESLAPFRVGSVPYLNAVPLTRGLENEIVLVSLPSFKSSVKRNSRRFSKTSSISKHAR